MPFIDCRTSAVLSGEVRERIKSRFGQAIATLKKPESFLMVGFTDGYELWFAGKRADRGAYVAVSLFGTASPSDCGKMTAKICAILAEEAGCAPEQTYVTYHPVENWDWNGSDFA